MDTTFNLSNGDLASSNKRRLISRGSRKKINFLHLTDRQRLPIAMSEPVSENHNDLFNIEVQYE